MNYGKMKEVDANNVQTGTFNASEIAVEGIFSYELARNLVGGITAKFITSYIGNYNSMAVGVDLGLNWYEPERQWSVSLVAKNLGGQIKAYEEEYGKMPIDVQVGVSKTFAALPVRVSANACSILPITTIVLSITSTSEQKSYCLKVFGLVVVTTSVRQTK